MELFKKKRVLSASSIRRQADRGRSEIEQRIIQQTSDFFDTGVSAGLQDMEHHKQQYDKVLLSKDFKGIRAYVLVFDQPPPVMCSSVYSLEYDFDGNPLQELGKLGVIAQQITFTWFYSGNHGFVVFSWLSERDTTCRQFIDSLIKLPPDQVTDVLMGFFFTYTENLHIQPDWWENLANNKRVLLIDWLTESMNQSLPRTLEHLASGIKFDNWPLLNTELIGCD